MTPQELIAICSPAAAGMDEINYLSYVKTVTDRPYLSRKTLLSLYGPDLLEAVVRRHERELEISDPRQRRASKTIDIPLSVTRLASPEDAHWDAIRHHVQRWLRGRDTWLAPSYDDEPMEDRIERSCARSCVVELPPGTTSYDVDFFDPADYLVIPGHHGTVEVEVSDGRIFHFSDTETGRRVVAFELEIH